MAAMGNMTKELKEKIRKRCEDAAASNIKCIFCGAISGAKGVTLRRVKGEYVCDSHGKRGE